MEGRRRIGWRDWVLDDFYVPDAPTNDSPSEAMGGGHKLLSREVNAGDGGDATDAEGGDGRRIRERRRRTRILRRKVWGVILITEPTLCCCIFEESVLEIEKDQPSTVRA